MHSPDESALQDVFVGRQPIYGRRLELYAYELLYRGRDVDFAEFSEGDRATSQVLLNTFVEFGIERVVGDHLAFVNLTRGFIVGEYPIPVPRDQVVLEVLEDIYPDEQVLQGLANLRRQGFVIALDDFVYDDDFKPLLKFADIVKVDVLGLGPREIKEKVELLKPHGLRLLAEKIETREQFDACRDAGFHYFQGYFLAKPNVVQGTTIPASSVSLLRLLAELQSPSCSFDRVQEIVSQDVTLSYKMLRHINSAIYGMPRRIDSVRETVVYLGLKAVKNMACLCMLSSVDTKPHDLFVTSMLRGRMCQQLAKATNESNDNSFFTVGLFSTLDALMDAPMATVLQNVPLTDAVRAAILEREGDMGAALSCAIHYERGEWGQVRYHGLTRAEIKQAFLEAVDWVETVDREITAVAA